jgi:hypothetical protein
MHAAHRCAVRRCKNMASRRIQVTYCLRAWQHEHTRHNRQQASTAHALPLRLLVERCQYIFVHTQPAAAAAASCNGCTPPHTYLHCWVEVCWERTPGMQLSLPAPAMLAVAHWVPLGSPTGIQSSSAPPGCTLTSCLCKRACCLGMLALDGRRRACKLRRLLYSLEPWHAAQHRAQPARAAHRHAAGLGNTTAISKLYKATCCTRCFVRRDLRHLCVVPFSTALHTAPHISWCSVHGLMMLSVGCFLQCC